MEEGGRRVEEGGGEEGGRERRVGRGTTTLKKRRRSGAAEGQVGLVSWGFGVEERSERLVGGGGRLWEWKGRRAKGF